MNGKYHCQSIIKQENDCNIQPCISRRLQMKSTSVFIKQENDFTSTPFDCVSKTLEPYHCDNCGFQTNLIINFKKHLNPDVHTDITDACEKYVCSSCNFKTFSKLVFMKHTYDKCNKDKMHTLCKRMNVYNDKHNDYLKCHRFLKCIPYDNIRWLKCQHCSYKTKIKGDLKKHMGTYHMLPQRVKWFECDQCLYNVKQIFHLREHVLTEHPGDVSCFD